MCLQLSKKLSCDRSVFLNFLKWKTQQSYNTGCPKIPQVFFTKLQLYSVFYTTLIHYMFMSTHAYELDIVNWSG